MPISRAELIEILAEADPVGLIEAGAPRDEYAGEADAILALKGVPRLTEITGIFGVSFADPGACRRETARWILDEMAEREQTAPSPDADDQAADDRHAPGSGES